MKMVKICAAVMLVAIGLAACSGEEKKTDSKAKPRGTLVTTVKAQTGPAQDTQEAIGVVESKSAPFVNAEVPGKVKRVYVDVGQDVKAGQKLALLDDANLRIARASAEAETGRLSAMVNNQERAVRRYEKLAKENFVNQSQLDDTKSQLKVLTEQLAGAKARLARVNKDLGRAVIVAPAPGKVERKLVDKGDYVSVGKPLFRIASGDYLRVRLPFPETVAGELHTGQKVILSTPTVPGKTVEKTIGEIRPMITTGARAVEVIVDTQNPGGWKPGASVKGVVIVGQRAHAVMAPERCVVPRPAGQVVYVIESNVAHQRVVTTGVRQDGMVEITSGLAGGETLAYDGAPYLTDNAPVMVMQGN